ncbi:MAG: YceI family protein [Pelagibacteraceae bacterium TMED124]|nr:lipid-binding protein [Candidatus Neomarinimicrobiota bacterium]RPG19314.1 MAG: YceI family protein [Pelagibacteraceae bacterium TMED124]
MRTFFLLYIIFSIIYSEKYILNTDQSKVLWVGSKVTGEHYGEISIKEGFIDIRNDSILGGNIIIDMNTIKVLDIENYEWNKKLENHLKDDDFFSVEKYPFASFEINKTYQFIMVDNIAIEGIMTIKDIKNEIIIPASIHIDNNYAKSIGVATIDRTDFDIIYGSGSFFENLSDRMIYDDFTIKFSITAEK